MQPLIRPARPGDAEAIAAWTHDTFSWGDYVAQAVPGWMEEPDSLVAVAEIDGEIVGVSRTILLSPTEAWAQGTRIHPDRRRTGIGMALAEHLGAWAADRGALVMRSMIEAWNEPARSQSRKLGYREVGIWLRAGRGVGENSPVPEGNGGRRVAAAEGLLPAHSSEAIAAMMSWSGGDLERAARGLLPVGVWRMRRLVPADLADAARRKALLVGRPGWAVGEVEDDAYEVSWISTAETDIGAMLRALVDRAAAAGAEEIRVMFPATAWMEQALRRRGFTIHDLRIYAKPLPGASGA
ncbi:MAG: GNAT family N-acetyltransferase [Acidimicrobiia bacterium]|nr:GNAT family N-acetyltransferase [Acidimicrobiia bacterium]